MTKKSNFTPNPQDITIIEPNKNALAIPQNTQSNILTTGLSPKRPYKIDRNGSGVLEIRGNIITIKNFKKVKLGTSVSKTLDIYLAKADDLNDPLICISIDEWMSLRGYSPKSKSTARQQIKKDIEALKQITYKFSHTEYGKNKEEKILNMDIYGGTDYIDNNVVFFRFNPDYINTFRKNQFLFLHKEALAYDDNKYPYAYSFHRYIALNKRRNKGKPNENIVSVKSLIEECPNFPKYDKKRGEFRRLILDRFMKSLDVINAFDIEFIGGEPLKYDEFISKKIKVNWNEEEENPDSLHCKYMKSLDNKIKKNIKQ